MRLETHTYWHARSNLPGNVRIAIRDAEPPLDDIFVVVAMFNEDTGAVCMRLVIRGLGLSDYNGIRRELDL